MVKTYSKEEIIKMIEEAPEKDYVGEYLQERLQEPFSKK